MKITLLTFDLKSRENREYPADKKYFIERFGYEKTLKGAKLNNYLQYPTA
jgi:hypothetical protein